MNEKEQCGFCERPAPDGQLSASGWVQVGFSSVCPECATKHAGEIAEWRATGLPPGGQGARFQIMNEYDGGYTETIQCPRCGYCEWEHNLNDSSIFRCATCAAILTMRPTEQGEVFGGFLIPENAAREVEAFFKEAETAAYNADLTIEGLVESQGQIREAMTAILLRLEAVEKDAAWLKAYYEGRTMYGSIQGLDAVFTTTALPEWDGMESDGAEKIFKSYLGPDGEITKSVEGEWSKVGLGKCSHCRHWEPLRTYRQDGDQRWQQGECHQGRGTTSEASSCSEWAAIEGGGNIAVARGTCPLCDNGIRLQNGTTVKCDACGFTFSIPDGVIE